MIRKITLKDDYQISTLIKGGWQLSEGHTIGRGPMQAEQAVQDMHTFVEAGVTTFDCADIYTGVEDMIGAYVKRYGAEGIQVHTKYVPDLGSLQNLQAGDVEKIIDRSLSRLGMERLDLVQFHWWDLGIPGYVEAMLALQKLQQAGKIRYLAVTNFDAETLAEILAAGVQIAAAQVQYSVLDQRPAGALTKLAQEHDFKFLCYGTVAGGFLSERYLGQSEPTIEGLENRSLVKYKLIIEECGGESGSWAYFQHLLETLHDIGQSHGASLTDVAIRYTLAQPRVAAAIVGARSTAHLASLQRTNDLVLSAEDMARLDAVIAESQGPMGKVYALERDRNGKHGSIMKYNLNDKKRVAERE